MDAEKIEPLIHVYLNHLSTISALPAARCGSSLHLLGDPLDCNALHSLLVCFGQSHAHQTERVFYSDVFEMDLKTKVWRTLAPEVPRRQVGASGLAPIVAGRAEQASCVVGGKRDKILFFGARHSLNRAPTDISRPTRAHRSAIVSVSARSHSRLVSLLQAGAHPRRRAATPTRCCC